jgi:phosphoglycolate phosphatase-like HAD superfamily hydrolase
MDGTLTVAMHDFDALRARLGLPHGAPILETCRTHPNSEDLLAEIQVWEQAIAELTTAEPDALRLLEWLAGRVTMGVLTRNTKATALRTLEIAGMANFFAVDAVFGRDNAAAKPDPEGVVKLLRLWDADPTDAVMVGDYVFDLQAGRAAGTATVWIDRLGGRDFHPWADRRVTLLDQLIP